MSATLTTPKTTSGGEIITHLINSTDGTGLHFDGAAGNVQFTPVDLGTKFSFEFIVQQSAEATETLYLVDYATGGRFIIGSHPSGTSGNFGVYSGAAWGNFGLNPLSDNKVHHIVVTIDGTSAILFDNANQIATATITSPDIDSCVAARWGSAFNAAENFFNGTMYRARNWSKTLSQAEVTSRFEQADVPFADQWGAPAVGGANDKIEGDFTYNLDGWDAVNTWNSQTNPATNMVLAANATGQNCRTANLLVPGYSYRCFYTASATAGAPAFAYHDGSALVAFPPTGSGTSTISNGTQNTFDFVFPSDAPYGYFYIFSTTASDAVTIDDIHVILTGCVSDYDLAFANPTQSLTVQDRAGNADGTSSATGVSQVTKLEQVNTNKLSVGGVTPLVGIGLAAGVTPSEALHITSATSDKPIVLIENTAGDNSPSAVKLFKNTESPADGDQIGDLMWYAKDDGAATLRYVLARAKSTDVSAGTTDSELEFFTRKAGAETSTLKLVSGKVGIGVTPAYTFEVATGADAAVFEYADHTTGTQTIKFAPSATKAGGTSKIYSSYAGTGATEGKLALGTYSAQTALTIDSTGITTFSKDVKITSAANVYLSIDNTGVNGDEWQLFNAVSGTSSTLQFKNIDTSKVVMLMDESGKIGVNQVSPQTTIHLKQAGNTWNDGILLEQSATTTGWNIRGNDTNGQLVFAHTTDTTNNYSATTAATFDNTGLMTVKKPGWPLKNEISNSGFDVWSNSTLEDVGSDLSTNGTFASDTGWTKETGWTISGGNAVATNVADGDQMWQTVTGLTVGKLYQLTVNVNGYTDGSVAVRNSTVGVESAALSGTGSATVVFEAAATSNNIAILARTASTDLTVAYVTLYEVTPGCVAATNKAFDGWTKRDNVSHKIYRQHSDGGTLTHDGSFYSVKVVTTTETASQVLTFPGAYGSNAEWYERFAGRTVTLGCWVKCSVASSAKLVISDGVTTDSASSFHTGGGAWEWLEVTKSDTSASPTKFTVGLATIKADTTYFSQVMAVIGSAIGSGNYSRPMGEIVWCETAIGSNHFDGVAGFSNVGTTTMNLEADSNGKIPKGAEAVSFKVQILDSVSSTNEANLQTGGLASLIGFTAEATGYPNGVRGLNTGWTACDSNGDYNYYLNASGSGTLSFANGYKYTGVQLR